MVAEERICWELDLATAAIGSVDGTITLAEYGDFDRFHAALPAMEFGEVVSPEEFRLRFLAEERFASMQILSLDADSIVGVACLRPRPGTTVATNAGSGVLRSHRRRGIGTALKNRAIVEARKLGFTKLETGNETKSVAALALIVPSVIAKRESFARSPGQLGDHSLAIVSQG